MADLLIRHLKDKGAEHSALSLLVSQWGFDEKLIPKALQTIGGLFPHYSRHDESHSRQILINIERLLGEEGVALLSATDTWLLLESAYWHDIGMVVSRSDMVAAMSDVGFKEFISDICDKPHHDLHRFAKDFQTQESARWFVGADSPMQAVEKFRELMSEWFRRKHSERAGLIVNAPLEVIGVSSPRTELIPARLFRMLGRICQMHGRPFEDILHSSGLPFKQAGIAQDDCHPRFIACLLRMGDLLDLDDNRFCPVMQLIAGDERPALSKAHEEKHSSIRHLRVDRNRIEIKAECSTIEGYIETCKWFEWLKGEMHSQMAHWQDIVPSRDLGLLPTLGDFEVLLTGEFEVLKKGQRPQFSIDTNKAFDLIQGSNIYSTNFAYVREILQNAVDATLINIWLIASSNSKVDWSNPRSARGFLEKQSVFVELIEGDPLEFDGLQKQGSSVWTLRVTDSGTGIGVEDLGYMLRIGASQENRRRQDIIKRMPEWLKPSGAFGIGLQSVFMVCDTITINTKDVFSNGTLEVLMNSPTSEKEGIVFIKRKPNDVSVSPGTAVEFQFRISPPRSSPLSNRSHSIQSSVAVGYDPIYGESFCYEAANIADKIIEFAGGSLIPINGVMRTLRHGEFPLSKTTRKESFSGEFDYVKVDEDVVGVAYRFFDDKRGAPRVSLYYRGQAFNFGIMSFPLVDVSINLMSGKAGDWLSASRSEVAVSARVKLEELIFAALESKLSKDMARAEGWDDAHEKNVSLFLAVMAYRHGEGWRKLSEELGDKWLDIQVGQDTLRSFFNKSEWLVGRSVGLELSNESNNELIIDRKFDYLRPVILSKWLEQKRNYITALAYSDLEHVPDNDSGEKLLGSKSDSFKVSKNYGLASVLSDVFKEDLKSSVFYRMSKSRRDPYTSAALAAKLYRLISEGYANQRFTLATHPILKKWKDLELKEFQLGGGVECVFPELSGRYANILMPFLFKKEQYREGRKVDCGDLNELCVYVQTRLVKSVPFEKIKQLYIELIDFLDELMRSSPYAAEWKKCRVVRSVGQ